MRKNSAIAREDLEHMIEMKILEILGDPDAGIELRDKFKAKLRDRLNRPPRIIPQEEVLKELG